jgi:hypothetical protein
MRLIDGDKVEELLVFLKEQCEKEQNPLMGAMWGSFQAVLEFVREQPTIEPVQRGEREINADELLKRLDQYFEDNGLEHKWTGDEIADSMSGTVEDIVRIVKEMLGESDDEDEETWW